jgi:hypothetical protein
MDAALPPNEQAYLQIMEEAADLRQGITYHAARLTDLEARLGSLEARLVGTDFINAAQMKTYMVGTLAHLLKQKRLGNEAAVHAEVKRQFQVPTNSSRKTSLTASNKFWLTGIAKSPAPPRLCRRFSRDRARNGYSEGMPGHTPHKIVLSDETWARTGERAALEEKSASALCEFVLRHYLDLADTQKPPILWRRASPSGRARTVYLDKAIWAEAVGRKVMEGRSISAILEQPLRAYLTSKLIRTARLVSLYIGSPLDDLFHQKMVKRGAFSLVCNGCLHPKGFGYTIV